MDNTQTAEKSKEKRAYPYGFLSPHQTERVFSIWFSRALAVPNQSSPGSPSRFTLLRRADLLDASVITSSFHPRSSERSRSEKRTDISFPDCNGPSSFFKLRLWQELHPLLLFLRKLCSLHLLPQLRNKSLWQTFGDCYTTEANFKDHSPIFSKYWLLITLKDRRPSSTALCVSTNGRRTIPSRG